MSTHNRQVEHVHGTLMGKACAMRSACDMPPNHWDKFIITVCYLINRTPVKSQNGHTLYERWYGTKPDLFHLQEISCRAFVLIQNSHNPKVFDWSIECVLIGYSQDLKAYHLFHHPSKKILVSYHISFIESHQDTNPSCPHATPSSSHTGPLTIQWLKKSVSMFACFSLKSIAPNPI